MNEKEDKKIELWKVVAISAILAFAMANAVMMPSGAGGSDPGSVSGTFLPDAANVTNATIMGDAAQIMGYYPSLDLYVTLPTGTAAPMITPFLVNVTAGGQAVADLYVGNSLYATQQFSGNAIIYDNASYTGNLNLTLHITTAAGTVSYRWLPDFMSPVTYISYEHAKTKATAAGLSYEDVAAIGVAIILSAVAFFKIFYPGAKARVRKMWIKEGPKRHV